MKSEEERKAISERTKQMMAEKRSLGLKIGRDRSVSYERIVQLRDQGLSRSQIAARMNCSIGVVDTALRKNKTKLEPKEGL